MRALDLSAMAGRDLMKIRSDSSKQWGAARANRYILELRRRMERLRGMPELGPVFGVVRPGLRRLVVGSHVVFYRFDDQAIRVVRILHQHMDVALHLGKPTEP